MNTRSFHRLALPDTKFHGLKNGAPQEATHRLKQYPEGKAGIGAVFFRPKVKALNTMQICKDLARFTAVTEITKVRPNKLRVLVSDLKQSNELAACELFTREYHVYIPARVVEIDGVVSESSLTVEDLLKAGKGLFKDSSLKPAKILECKQLHSVSLDKGVKTYTPSDSFRVTFAGSALPSYVLVDKVRLPVRLFVPRVMNCLKCKQLGQRPPTVAMKHVVASAESNMRMTPVIRVLKSAFIVGRLRMSCLHVPRTNSAKTRSSGL